MRKDAISSPSVQPNGGGEVESPARHGTAAKTILENPPSYGTQYLQDALWKGGNEALPPGWHKFDGGDGVTQYKDVNLAIATFHRPLPGIRLDYSGQLSVPGCEWYISPLGRSYFVNHNTRTTSWKKPTPEHPPASLRPDRIIQAHSRPIWNLVYSRTIVSVSDDGSIRRCNRDGKAVGRPWYTTNRGKVGSIAVSPNETMVVTGGEGGRIWLWDIKKGRIIGKPWEGHKANVRCVDWSPNGQEIASGSEDGTIRRWNPATGQQIASPIEACQGWVYSIKYSRQGDKFASCGSDGMVWVWSTGGELLIEIKAHDDGRWIGTLCWSKDGTSIFSGSGDCTVREWRLIDGKQLNVFQGHTRTVKSLCLSSDGCHLLSASNDCSIRIWDLSTNKAVGEPLLHDDEVRSLATSPDGQYVASAGLDGIIYLWNLETVLKQRDGNTASDAKLKEHVSSSGDILNISTKSEQRLNNTGVLRYGNDFWSNDANRSIRDSAPVTSPSPRRRNLFDFVRFDTRSIHGSPQMAHQRRRWNFSFSTKRAPDTADVAAAQDVNRIYISPPTDEEIAAAMQASFDEINGPAPQKGGGAVGVQSPRAPSAGDESSCTIGCCGFFLVFGSRRS